MIWYLFIFLGALLEGELTLVLAGFGLVQGRLALPIVICIATLGGFLGDWLFFELGERKGDALRKRWPKVADGGVRVIGLLTRWPVLFLFILRFQIAMRTVGHFSLGMSGKVTKSRYLTLNFLASVVWASVLVPLCRWFAGFLSALFSTL